MASDTGTAAEPQGLPSHEQLRELYRIIGGYRVSQAIYVVARLGIADRLADGPLSSSALAEVTGSHEPALYRLLRFLTGAGLFREVAPARFALTPLGAGLRTDVAGSLAPNVLMLLDDVHWSAWGELLTVCRPGRRHSAMSTRWSSSTTSASTPSPRRSSIGL